MKNRDDKKGSFTRINEQIRLPKIMLVRDGKQLGLFPTDTALKIAKEEGLDLVEIDPNQRPPICTIIDYGKHKYEQQKQKKAAKKNVVREKEVCFRYVIDENDLSTKVNQTKKILAEGDRVRLVVKFKQREHAHKDQGFLVMGKFLEQINDVATIDKNPSMEGNNIVCKISEKKK
jgi:translation initiation factor IF-3